MGEELIKLDNKIKDAPNIKDYPDIIKAAREVRFVIFIGAGVSKLINVPLWAEFAKGRLKICNNCQMHNGDFLKDIYLKYNK